MIYGLGAYAGQTTQLATDDNPRTQYDIGQAAQQMPDEDYDPDPLEGLF
jgi:hypothetical protein